VTELKVKVEGKVTIRLIERGKVVKEAEAKNDISNNFAISLANAMHGTSSDNKFYYPSQVQLYDANGNLITTLSNPSISGLQATWADNSAQAYTVASVKIIGKNAYDTVTMEIARATGLNVSKAADQVLQVIWTVSISGPLQQLALQIIQDCFAQGYSTRGNANRILIRDSSGNALASIALSSGYPTTGTGSNYAYCRVQGTYTPSAQQTVRYIDGAYYDGTTTTTLWSYQLSSDVTLAANTTYTFRTEIQFPWNYTA
jgi:hypothetical protein